MKKFIYLFILVLISSILIGCSSEKNSGENTTTTDQSISKTESNIDFTGSGSNLNPEDIVIPSDDISEVLNLGESTPDIDISKSSTTMVYSELYNLLVAYKENEGKIVKIKGVYQPNEYPLNSGKIYHCIVVSDATACCQQGIEFTLEPGTSYPKQGTTIVVTGMLESYTENGQTYCHLVVK